ncbi:SDR family oxidoreductase [Gordonia westfalica]|uniref:SDR family oxidoreductase n=1 Tax=Gordonia westfalica TaxID=158898 RepID=A0ABU2GRB4_9ACTN|nr:SDR family oxidoreductase [Gordonia westfalica]MDS1113430.1 SDR family oxidoreductase [Gordonia westfalica]
MAFLPIPRSDRKVDLTGKVALITGAGNGIGKETALRLAGVGARLILVDIDRSAVDDVAATIGTRASGYVADVTDYAALDAAVRAGVERFGGIDIVVANAGVGTYGSFRNMDPETFRRGIDINVNGVFFTVRAALASIIERRGYLLLVSSMTAFLPGPGMGPYAPGKAAVDHLATSLRAEVGRLGVAVGSAHMSWIDTPLIRDIQSDLSVFDDYLKKLGPPLDKIVGVDVCADAFVRGIARRQRRIYVPGWVAVAAWCKHLLSTRLGDRLFGPELDDFLEKTDAVVAEQHRASSGRNVTTANMPTVAETGR